VIVTAVSTLVSFSSVLVSVFWPTETCTFGFVTFAKPCSSYVSVYSPGLRFRKRYSPRASDVWVFGAPGPARVTVTPGRRPPCSSATFP